MFITFVLVTLFYGKLTLYSKTEVSQMKLFCTEKDHKSTLITNSSLLFVQLKEKLPTVTNQSTLEINPNLEEVINTTNILHGNHFLLLFELLNELLF